jgi:hypothetical protein
MTPDDYSSLMTGEPGPKSGGKTVTHRTYKERWVKKSWLTNMVNGPRRRVSKRDTGEMGEDQTACKPGSVPPACADAAAIPLDRPLLDGSRDLPGRLGRRGPAPDRNPGRDVPIRSCSRWGLPCRLRCRRRGALLPHPFTLAPGRGPKRFAFCGAIPGVAPGGRYPPPIRRGARTFLPFPERKERPPGRLVRAENGRGVAPGQARRQASRSSAISRARVSPSATPSTFSGRQCRWKAVMVVAQASS